MSKIADQYWNERTMVRIYRDFVAMHGLTKEFEAFLQDIADEWESGENDDTDDDTDDCLVCSGDAYTKDDAGNVRPCSKCNPFAKEEE